MSERNFSLLESWKSEASRLGREGLDALTSLSGGALGVINTLRSHGFRKGTLILLTLALGISACGGGPGSTVEAPTPGNGGEANARQPIDVVPTAESISTTEPFVPYAAGGELSEAQITFLESSKGRDLINMYGLWGDKWIKDKVFGADTTLSLLPMEDQADPTNIDKMTLVGIVNAPGDDSYEGYFITPPVDIMDLYLHGDPARGIEPGDINQLQPPENIVLEPFKMSRVVGEGSVPANAGIPLDSILQFKDQRFVYMYGSVGNLRQVGVINEANQWEASEGVPSETGIEIKSPFKEADTQILNEAGYGWDSANGALVSMRNGQPILWFDGRSWVDEDGVESSIESLKINMTSGVDFDGNPIVAMLTRTVEIDGEMETQVYGPLSEEWFKPADILASQAMMDQNIPEVSLTNWGDFRKISFEDIPIVTQEFAESHKLLESQWLFLREWPENVREPKLQCVKRDVLGNIWVLTQYPLGVGSHYTGNIYYQREPGERPVVWSTDGIDQNLSVVRFQNSAGEWVIEQGIQYYVKGKTVVLSVRHTGAYADPNHSYFSTTQQFLTNPEYQVVEPRCSLPQIRPLMPQALRAKMAELDSNPEVLARDAGYYQLDFVTMAKLQGISFEGTGAEWWEQGYSFEKRWLEAYLRDEADPLFDEQFPERKK